MKSNRGRLVMPLLILLPAITAVLTLLTVIRTKDMTLFWFSLAMTAISVAAVLLFRSRFKRDIEGYASDLAVKLGLTGSETGVKLPVPAASVSEDGEIIWYNDAFRLEMLDGGDGHAIDIARVCKGITPAELTKPLITGVKREKRFYDVTSVEDSYDGRKQYLLFFDDVTDRQRIQTLYRDTRPAVLLVVFDNEDELLKLRENERMAVLSAIDTLVNDWMKDSAGICRSDARSTGLIIVDESELKEMIADRFSILSEARKIAVSGGQFVTLSIGIGRGGSTLAECEVWAQQALDMALGRGGDQVAIKENEEYTFFGGVTKSSEKQSKVKTRMLAKAIAELIGSSDRCFVMGHRFSDLDSIGAAIGMASISRSIGVESYVAVDTETTLAMPLIESYSEHRGVPSGLFISPDKACSLITDQSVLIVVDTHSTQFIESKELYEAAKHVIVVDHHRLLVNKISHPAFFFHEPFASSASEMVAELAQYINEKAISGAEAEALLAGIMLDTKSFVLRTGVRTFEAATFLRRRGADTVDVKMLFAGSLENYAEKTRLVSTAKIYRECAIAYTETEFENMRVVAAQAADEMLSLQGVSASFVLFTANGSVDISARSFGKLNVQLVMEQLGGGGHMTMAGAQLAGSTMSHALGVLTAAIDSVCDAAENK